MPDLSKLNIDFDEMKRLGTSLFSKVSSDSNLLENLKKEPVSTIKNVLKGENVSENTEAAVNEVLEENKNSDLKTILGKIGNLVGDKGSEIFEKIGSLVDGIDLNDVIENVSDLLEKNEKTKGISNILNNFIK